MPDPRILYFPVPIVTTAPATTAFQIQFSPDRVNWGTLLVGGVSDQPVASLSNRVFLLDGINAPADSATSNLVAASTPPMWYRIRLKATTTYGPWLEEFAVPSAADFLLGIKSELKDPSLNDPPGVPLLADLDYRQCLATAVEQYGRLRPRLDVQLYTLTSKVQSYPLPDGWIMNYSRIFQVEYPANQVPRRLMDLALMTVDEQYPELRFIRVYPATNDQARIFYTRRHAADGSSVYPQDFNGVRLLAAANAAGQIYRQKNQFGDIRIGADYIGMDPRIKNWAATAEELKRQANRLLGSGANSVRTHIDQYDYHGAIPPAVLFYGP